MLIHSKLDRHAPVKVAAKGHDWLNRLVKADLAEEGRTRWGCRVRRALRRSLKHLSDGLMGYAYN